MRIIDCFPYNGEAIALFRMAYLWDVVDEFVIVEAGETHTGLKKDGFFLDRNADLLRPFAGKMTPLMIEAFPAPTPAQLAALRSPNHDTDPAAWFREKYQRNFALDYLRRLGEKEPYVVAGCDADEIPRKEIVASLADNYDKLSIGYKLQMAVFYYSSRWMKPSKWYHPFIANDRALRQETLDGLRIGPAIKKIVGNAGWHFTYFMTEAEIQRKLQAFAHTECNSEDARKLEWIRECRRTGRDLHHSGEDCLAYGGDDLPAGLRAFEAEFGIAA